MYRKVRVKEWISYEESFKYTKAPCTLSGGWFGYNKKHHRWKDYRRKVSLSMQPYVDAIRNDVLSKKLKITEDEHIYSDYGVPLFSDVTVGIFPCRAWGDLMAAIWSDEDNQDYCYIDFYSLLS